MDKTNIRKRGNTYYVRVAIPRHLQDALGKPEIVRSLKTTSLTEANRLKHAVIGEIRALITDAERTHGRTHNASSSNPVNRLLAELRRLRRERKLGMVSADEVDITKDVLADQAYDLDVTDPGTVSVIRSALDAVTDDSVLYLSEAVDLYLDAHRPPVITKQTYATKRKRLVELQAYLGADLDIRHVTGQMAGQYITTALLKRDLAPKTVKDYITDLSVFFAWCEVKDAISTNPFKGKVRLVKESKRGTTSDTKPRPWSPEELLLFAKGAPTEDRHYLLVFFIFGLYTGARLNELAELKLQDVHEDYLSIKEGKTTAALRDVPLHTLLVPLVTYLQQVSTDEYLIPGLLPGGANGRRGHYVSKRFTTLRRKLGITDPGCRYHSLRGNFITALERARVPLNEIESLIGHKRKALAYGTYSAGVDLEHQRENVESVTFGSRVDSVVAERIVELTEAKA